MITEFAVGQKFPLQKYLNRGEITVSILNQQFFEILCCISHPNAKEIQAFKNGNLTLSLYVTQNTPFIICDFGGGFNFDVSININLLSLNDRAVWLNAKANIISLYLVDATSGVLQVIRTISIPFAQDIKNVLEKQPANADSIIANVMESTTTKKMITRRDKYFKFQ